MNLNTVNSSCKFWFVCFQIDIGRLSGIECVHSINFYFSFCVLFIDQIRRQAIKELPRFATGDNIPRVADILTQLLQTGNNFSQKLLIPQQYCWSLLMFVDVFVLPDDTAEFNQVNAALISIFKMDARGKFLFPLGQNWNVARPVLIIKTDFFCCCLFCLFSVNKIMLTYHSHGSKEVKWILDIMSLEQKFLIEWPFKFLQHKHRNKPDTK